MISFVYELGTNIQITFIHWDWVSRELKIKTLNNFLGGNTQNSYTGGIKSSTWYNQSAKGWLLTQGQAVKWYL